MQAKTLTAALAALLVMVTQAPVVANAAGPKPPTDARKVVHTQKTTQLEFEAGSADFILATTMSRDFDLTFSIINPEMPNFVVGAQFRAVSYSRWYALLIGSDGETGLLISRDADNVADVKPSVFAPSWKKNVGEKNDIGLYARGTGLQLFINKVLVDSWDIGEINDFGNMWLLGAGPRDKAGSIAVQNFIVKVPGNAIPPEASTVTNKNIAVSLYRSSYNRWGRPSGFDNPRTGCQAFDDSRPVTQFQAVMKVTNNGTTPMKRWVPFAFTRSGKLAFGCALAYDHSPLVQPGGSADITMEYYIEQGDAIAYIVVFDLDNGRSNKLTTPAP